jgi:urease beta subunit
MKKMLNSALLALTIIGGAHISAQQPAMQYFRNYDQAGINVFETSKNEGAKYDGMKVRIGGGFTQQYQSLSHENTAPTSYVLSGNVKHDRNMPYPITSGFNTASANLMFDIQLEDGIRLNLTSYLASRHHNETWVKGGFIQIDKMKFMKSELIDDIFKYATLKVGHQEINYGDAHFRRSDGGSTLYNPFIENYIIDAFATEIGGEVYFQSNGFLAMVGVTNGEIKGNVDPIGTLRNADSTLTYSDDARSMSFLWKIGYDDKVTEDIRFRATASGYMKGKNGSNTLYSGDRTGSNYYLVMESAAANFATNPASPKPVATTQFTSGRFNPGMNDEVNAMMFNALLEGYGLEIFFNYDINTGRSASAIDRERAFSQLAIDGIYRFSWGGKNNLFAGVRYNTVTAEAFNLAGTLSADKVDEIGIDRTAIAAGWFITPSVLLKGEYVMQNYKDFPTNNIFNGGSFNGVVVEAVVGF